MATRIHSSQTNEIISNLYYGICTGAAVTVTTPEGESAGRFVNPGGEGAVVAFAGVRPPLMPSMPACLEYEGPGDVYRFYSEVLRQESEGVRFAFPLAVDRSDRRASHRFVVDHVPGFHFRLDGPDPAPRLRLHDLSPTGLCLQLDEHWTLAVGQQLEGAIEIAGEAPAQVTLEVRYFALRQGRMLVGAHFAEMSIRDRGLLAMFLARWAGEDRRRTTADPPSAADAAHAFLL